MRQRGRVGNQIIAINLIPCKKLIDFDADIEKKAATPVHFSPPRDVLIWFMGLLFGCNQAALADPANHILTKSDIQQVLRMFSTVPCDISEFSKSSQSLGFKPFWTEYDDLEEMPLIVLDQDSLCLIALNSSFKAYRMTKTKDGDKELTLAAP